MHTLFTGQRERKGGGREKEGGGRERERERERERKKEGGRERERERIFLKGMTGALAPFSYLVANILAYFTERLYIHIKLQSIATGFQGG